jgi:hypothetical protein
MREQPLFHAFKQSLPCRIHGLAVNFPLCIQIRPGSLPIGKNVRAVGLSSATRYCLVSRELLAEADSESLHSPDRKATGGHRPASCQGNHTPLPE